MYKFLGMKPLLTLLCFSLFAVGCADDKKTTGEDSTNGDNGEQTTDDNRNFDFDPVPFDLYTPDDDTPESVAYETGMTQYLNAAKPSDIRHTKNTTVYEFDQEDGPICMRGKTFRTMTRKAEGSNDLMIFLQGGGACWDDFCLAVINTPTKFPDKPNILDKNYEANPVKDWNVAYVPYCDGSLFIGDRTETDDKGERIYAGLHNLSAALSVTKEEFPSPDRILFAGSSAGGFATIMTTPLVRYLWPDTPIYVVADSAVGVAKDGEPEFINMLVDTFGAEQLIPEDCPDCISDGNITGFIDYYLPKDDNIRVGLYTSWYDAIIAETFLQIDPANFQESVERITGKLHDDFPDKYRRFITNNRNHTALLGDPSGIIGNDLAGGLEISGGNLDIGAVKLGKLAETIVEDMHLGEWIDEMLNDGAWEERIEPADYEAVFGD